MSILRAEVRPYGFAPTTAWDDEQKRKYPVGAVVYLTVRKGRSEKMERFYWGLVDHVAKAIGYDKEILSDELLWRTKRVDEVTFINGDMKIKPKRISKMRHEEFKNYVDAAIDLVCQDYLGQMSPGELLSDVEKMLNITYAEAFAPERAKKGKNNGLR